MTSNVDIYGYCHSETTTYSNIIKAFKAYFSANQHPELYDDNIRQEEIFWVWELEVKYSCYSR